MSCRIWSMITPEIRPTLMGLNKSGWPGPLAAPGAPG
jgi:hypothetical protein